MAYLIDKSALVTEIEKLINEIYAGRSFDSLSSEQQTSLWYVKSIMSFINHLEVTEVDLNKEIDSYFKGFGKFASVGIDDCIDIAKYFFELGLKVTNSLTWQDIFIIRRLIYEYDKEIKMKSDIKYPLREEFCTEVLKRFESIKRELRMLDITL